VTGRARHRPCTAEEARTRAAHARAYLEVAKLIRGDADKDAVALLDQVRFGTGTGEVQARRARDLARALATALDLTDDSHYGTLTIGAAELRRLIRVAEVLVSAALEVT
jgi:hypothetical protein